MKKRTRILILIIVLAVHGLFLGLYLVFFDISGYKDVLKGKETIAREIELLEEEKPAMPEAAQREHEKPNEALSRDVDNQVSKSEEVAAEPLPRLDTPLADPTPIVQETQQKEAVKSDKTTETQREIVSQSIEDPNNQVRDEVHKTESLAAQPLTPDDIESEPVEQHTAKIDTQDKFEEYRVSISQQYSFEGRYIPPLVLEYTDAETQRKRLNTLGLVLIGRPHERPREPYYFLLVGNALRVVKEECPYRWGLAYLPGDKERLEETMAVGPPANLPATEKQFRLELFYGALNPATERYLQAKQAQALIVLKLKPEQAREIRGTLLETSFGALALVIKTVITSDGRAISYSDPDYDSIVWKG